MPITSSEVNMRYALPGFMPPEQPKEEAQNLYNWNEDIELVVLERPLSETELDRSWVLHLQGAGSEAIFVEGDVAVTDEVVDDSDTDTDDDFRQYLYQADAETLPPGTHLLEVSFSDGTFVREYVTVKAATENLNTPEEYIEDLEDGQTEDVS